MSDDAMIGLLTFLLIAGLNVFVTAFVWAILKRVPMVYRKIRPELVWLMAIPCLNVIWAFFVFPLVSQSLKAYFHDHERADVGSCGEYTGFFFCVFQFLSCLPGLGILGWAALVLLIVYFVQTYQLSQQIPIEAAQGL